MKQPTSLTIVIALVAALSTAPLQWRTARGDDPPDSPPTHRQTAIIQVVADGSRTDKLTTFALDVEGRVIAGVAGASRGLRVFEADGRFIAEWPLPMAPEAVHAAADGTIIAGGEGRLVRLAADGTLLQDRPSAQAGGARETARTLHATAMSRKQAQLQSTTAKKLASLEQRRAEVIAKLAVVQVDDAADKSAKLAAARRQAGYERMKASLDRQIAEASAPLNTRAATAAETQRAIDGLVTSQLQIISISSTPTEVYVACRSSTGHGFDVWRTNPDFRGGQRIIESLRGCCGQMDVQANANGVYVAENTRHRVRVFGRDGRLLGEFGSRDRAAPDGFDGCCNPMNVAFGPNASVYTAEAGSGRIKRFSSRGQFMELVGNVELVPGCKKVAIAVSPDGNSVYMLDITRGHIVRMEAVREHVGEVHASSRS
jgi:hypothetical protein